MKSASTTARENELLEIFNGSVGQPVCYVEYYDSINERWLMLQSAKTVRFSRNSKADKVGEYFIVPPAQTLNLTIDNEDGQYSPGGSGEFADILVRDLKIRAQMGYVMSTASETTYEVIESVYTTAYHTKVESNIIKPDISDPVSFAGVNGITDIWTFYGDLNYGSGTYNAEGYYLSEILDFSPLSFEKLTALKMQSNSEDIFVYYRSSDNKNMLINDEVAFTLCGELASGSNSFVLPDVDERWFQFCLVFATSHWVGAEVSVAQIDYDSYAEVFDTGEFYLDSATFASDYDSKTVNVSCRDQLKKALATKISTPDYSSDDVGEILRDICDRCGIEHNDGVTEFIDDTTYTVTCDAFINETANDAINECMFYLNSKDEDYRLFVNDDGYLQLEIRDISLTNYDFALNYINHLFSYSRSFKSDDTIAKVTAYSGNPTSTSAEELLASANYTSTGTKTLSWSGDATNKRYEFVHNNTTSTFSNPSFENEEFSFDIGGSSPNTSVSVYGTKTTLSGAYLGEAVNEENFESNIGYTIDFVNRLLQSNDEAKTFAEQAILRYSPEGDINFSADANFNYFPLLEINDKCILIEANTLTFQLFAIDNLSVSYSAADAKATMSVNFKQLGGTLENLIFDRNGIFIGIDDLSYDSNIFWDMDIFGEDSDTNTYHKAVQFS
jgi:hypothetical protein